MDHSGNGETLRIAISVGELSADEHAASLVTALRALVPGVEVRGMGGRHMRCVGVDTVVDSETCAQVMGFQEVVKSSGRIWGAYKRLSKLLADWRPHVVILVDYPDFNF